MANADAAERALYSYNAHNLITMWGPNGQISDYSSRLWGGLIRRYYKPRWRLAMEACVAALRANSGRHFERRAGGDDTFAESLREFEKWWQRAGDNGVGETVVVNEKKGGPTTAVLLAYDQYRELVTSSCKELKRD